MVLTGKKKKKNEYLIELGLKSDKSKLILKSLRIIRFFIKKKKTLNNYTGRFNFNHEPAIIHTKISNEIDFGFFF